LLVSNCSSILSLPEAFKNCFSASVATLGGMRQEEEW
jgi:hypothetical protein